MIMVSLFIIDPKIGLRLWNVINDNAREILDLLIV